MKPVALVVGNSPVRLWGLDGATRAERQLRAAGVELLVSGATRLPERDTVMLRGDFLFDARLVTALAHRPGVVLLADGPGDVVAAVHAPAGQADVGLAVLQGRTPAAALPGSVALRAGDLSPSWTGQLQKSSACAVVAIRAEDARRLSRHLFDGSYKGVTDLVTKWVWPAPARVLTAVLARRGIAPNAVTAAGALLVVATTALWCRGHFAAGLACAWLMTFLDTVDGKLARVTVTSSRFGHYLDHGIDLVHPPAWYAAWAVGLGAAAPGESSVLLVVLVASYVAGRLVEGAFDTLLAGFPLFSWKPVDSYFRLVLARRNPNLLLLTASWIAGRPVDGLVAVVAWTAVSSVVLALRLAHAVARRAAGRQLSPWLASPIPAGSWRERLARPFVIDPPSQPGPAR